MLTVSYVSNYEALDDTCQYVYIFGYIMYLDL